MSGLSLVIRSCVLLLIYTQELTTPSLCILDWMDLFCRDHLLHEWLTYLHSCPITRQMYESSAFLLDELQIQFLVNLLSTLKSYHIQLEPSITKGLDIWVIQAVLPVKYWSLSLLLAAVPTLGHTPHCPCSKHASTLSHPHPSLAIHCFPLSPPLAHSSPSTTSFSAHHWPTPVCRFHCIVGLDWTAVGP